MRKPDDSKKKAKNCPWTFKKSPKKRRIIEKQQREDEKELFKQFFADEELSA